MSFWRKEPPVIVDGRVTVGGMWEPTRRWWELKNFVKMLVTGFGGGKSYAHGKRKISTALENAPVPTAIVCPTYAMARKTMIPTIKQLLDGKCALRGDMSYVFNSSMKEFRISKLGRPDATLWVLSGEDPDSLKGPNLGDCGMDEPFLMDERVFDVMLSRVRAPEARIREITLTGTPEQLNWGYELAEGQLRDKHDVGIVQADTNMNLALPKDYRERMVRAYDELAAQAYVEGKFVNLSKGRVFHAFDHALHFLSQDPEMPSGATVFAGMDFNVNPMAFVAGWRAGNRMHVFKEWELPNSDTEDACAVLKRDVNGVRLVYPDPTCRKRATNAPGGMSDWRLIERAGLIPMAPTDSWPLRDSYNAVNGKFSAGRKQGEAPQLTVGPKCTKLKGYLLQHTHENMHKQEAMKHLLDGFRYAVTFCYPVGKPATVSANVVGL